MPELRSRHGCSTCRRRRRKCDEARPSCHFCRQRRVRCEYDQPLRWSTIATTDKGNLGVDVQDNGTSRNRTSRRRRQHDGSSEINTQRRKGPQPRAAREPREVGQLPLASEQQRVAAQEPLYSPQSASTVTISGQGPRTIVDHNQETIFITTPLALDELYSHRINRSLTSAINTPDIEENATESNVAAAPQFNALVHSAININGYGVWELEADNLNPDDNAEDDEGRTETLEWTLDDEDLWEGIDPDIFASPSERLAFAFWFKYLSGVIPAYDSASNPYRRLSYIALSSPVLLDTIISLATEYMYCHGRARPEITMERHSRALQSLRESLVSDAWLLPPTSPGTPATGNMAIQPQQATLAAILLQVANVIFTGGSGVDVHLSCAMNFLHTLDYVNHPVSEPMARLLVQRFAMIDVITSILRHRRPHLPSDFWLFMPDAHYDRTAPSFREMTGCPQPVLGFLARLANLAADQVDLEETVEADTPDYYERQHDILRLASTLETDMRVYARSRVTLSSTGRTQQQSHLDALSQCFYWSAHLIMQRSVYRDATSSPRVQHTVDNIVRCIKSMPVGCGPDSSLPFPFYLSSREAVTESHRAWVREHNNLLKQFYPGRLREAIRNSLEELWTLLDEKRPDRDRLNTEIDTKIRDLERRKDFCLF